MRTGIVYIRAHVLTHAQFQEIRAWRELHHLSDVYLKFDEKDMPYMEYWMMRYPTFLYMKKQPLNAVSEMFVYEENSLKEGNFEGLPVPLRGILIQNGLYRRECAMRMLKPSRVRHVESMTELTVHLAKIHGYDADKAEIAGLFHDCTKAFSDHDNEVLMKLCAPEHMDRPKAVYHQYTGAYYLANVLGYPDPEVYDAIYHHTDGDDPKTLSKILYLADKLDPSRGYDVSDMICLAETDLEKAVVKERELQLEFLRKEGKI